MSPSHHLLPDPDELRVAAGRLGQAAEAVRGAAARLQARVAATRWFSPAATVFRETATRQTGELRAAADHLDEAAVALRLLATRLEAAVHAASALAGHGPAAVGGR